MATSGTGLNSLQAHAAHGAPSSSFASSDQVAGAVGNNGDILTITPSELMKRTRFIEQGTNELSNASITINPLTEAQSAVDARQNLHRMNLSKLVQPSAKEGLLTKPMPNCTETTDLHLELNMELKPATQAQVADMDAWVGKLAKFRQIHNWFKPDPAVHTNCPTSELDANNTASLSLVAYFFDRIIFGAPERMHDVRADSLPIIEDLQQKFIRPGDFHPTKRHTERTGTYFDSYANAQLNRYQCSPYGIHPSYPVLLNIPVDVTSITDEIQIAIMKYLSLWRSKAITIGACLSSSTGETFNVLLTLKDISLVGEFQIVSDETIKAMYDRSMKQLTRSTCSEQISEIVTLKAQEVAVETAYSSVIVPADSLALIEWDIHKIDFTYTQLAGLQLVTLNVKYSIQDIDGTVSNFTVPIACPIIATELNSVIQSTILTENVLSDLPQLRTQTQFTLSYSIFDREKMHNIHERLLYYGNEFNEGFNVKTHARARQLAFRQEGFDGLHNSHGAATTQREHAASIHRNMLMRLVDEGIRAQRPNANPLKVGMVYASKIALFVAVPRLPHLNTALSDALHTKVSSLLPNEVNTAKITTGGTHTLTVCYALLNGVSIDPSAMETDESSAPAPTIVTTIL